MDVISGTVTTDCLFDIAAFPGNGGTERVISVCSHAGAGIRPSDTLIKPKFHGSSFLVASL